MADVLLQRKPNCFQLKVCKTCGKPCLGGALHWTAIRFLISGGSHGRRHERSGKEHGEPCAPLRRGTSSLEKWRGESVRDVGGIILALAPAYSPFAAAYFRVPRCSCEFSRESEVETQSSVMGLIFSATRQHHQYNCMSLSSEQGGWVWWTKLSAANLPDPPCDTGR